jgi:hypothetical protein
MRASNDRRAAQMRSLAQQSLKTAVRACIELAEQRAAQDSSTQRSMQRILALLWSVLDELEADHSNGGA